MTDPTEPVRVSDKRTGHHYTTTRASAEADSQLTVLRQDAVDPVTGIWFPPKTKTSRTAGDDLNDTADQADDPADEPSEEKSA